MLFSRFFWYMPIVMTELLAVTALFTHKLNKRRRFALRAGLSAAVLYAFAFAAPALYYNAWYAIVLFIAFFCLMLAAIKFCYDEPWVNSLFCGITAYTVRHLAYLIFNLAVIAFGLAEKGVMGAYLEAGKTEVNPLTVTAYITAYYVVCWLAYLAVGRQIRRRQDFRIDNISLIFLSMVIILVDIVFNAVTVYYAAENFDYTYYLIDCLYGIISCCLALYIQFTLLGKKRLKRELETIQTLWRRQQKQHAVSKDTIELINIKCHDLKHQLSALRGRIEESELKEIEKAVLIYDSYVNTGNGTLDVILTEKSLYCEKNGIQLSCRTDKSDISFISAADLCALFGNILDNAVEAVLKIEEPEKRVICLDIKTAGNFFSVRTENFYSGNILFADGLPVTDKRDKNRHGFGMKSIRLITERYGGNLTIRTGGCLFRLDILIPLKPCSRPRRSAARTDGEK